ncbi:D-ribose pyranase [Halarsenatibacter silvermanii]|uniref:D-ribose pyranase n=1 Tax=Halarsenatibacter silvermanii TaxID=321763 RepID=A0A1G9S333_9FIRM|nr:D-ribose pyranase [Halarsenatibacter silvermanii]SDM29832.1 ribose transport protein RbsD [Halarsenatibacter silvermanii]
MKRGELLNSYLSGLIADLGHKDKIVIADAGLPVPDRVEKIDLAVSCGLPGFIGTLKAVLSEYQIEAGIMAEDIKAENPRILDETLKILPAEIEPEYISHKEFKRLTEDCRAVIRTGECSPYANIVLVAGVTF